MLTKSAAFFIGQMPDYFALNMTLLMGIETKEENS
jgi:hypothetical protein